MTYSSHHTKNLRDRNLIKNITLKKIRHPDQFAKKTPMCIKKYVSTYQIIYTVFNKVVNKINSNKHAVSCPSLSYNTMRDIVIDTGK